MSTESRKLEKKLAHLRAIKHRETAREIYGGKPSPPQPVENSEDIEDTAL